MSQIKSSKSRPARFTMEGMIYNADQVLTSALDPEFSGIPKELVERCRGIVLMQVVSAGIIFSGTGGSGVMLYKHKTTGQWSAPCAVDVMGFGGGVVLGADVKHILIFIMDKHTMLDFAKTVQTRNAIQASVGLGKYGRNSALGMDAPEKGTVTITINKRGVFGGVSLDLGTMGACHEVNKKFYGTAVTPSQIFFEENAVTVPEDKGVPELHQKLKLLEEGSTWVPTAMDRQKSERLLAAAEKSAELGVGEEDQADK